MQSDRGLVCGMINSLEILSCIEGLLGINNDCVAVIGCDN